MNADRIAQWFEVFTGKLADAHAAHGYGWPIERLPAIVGKFRAFVEAGDLYAIDMLTPAWKATAKHFGVRPRRADITAYLTGGNS